MLFCRNGDNIYKKISVAWSAELYWEISGTLTWTRWLCINIRLPKQYYQTILPSNTTKQYYQTILPHYTTTQYYHTILPNNTTKHIQKLWIIEECVPNICKKSKTENITFTFWNVKRNTPIGHLFYFLDFSVITI